MSSSMSKTTGYVSKTDLFKIDPSAIQIRQGWNPRQNFDRAELDNLKESIRANGFYNSEPVLLCRRGTDLILVDGERRLRMVLELIGEGEPIKAIPAVLEVSLDEGELLARALSANSNAQALEPYDEARGMQRLINYGWNPQQIATRVGKSPSYVYARLTLLEATPEVQEAIAAKAITISDGVRVVRESHKKREPQATVLARKVAARQAPTVVEAEDDEQALVALVRMHGIPWVVSCLREMDFTSEVLIDAVVAYDEAQVV